MVKKFFKYVPQARGRFGRNSTIYVPVLLRGPQEPPMAPENQNPAPEPVVPLMMRLRNARRAVHAENARMERFLSLMRAHVRAVAARLIAAAITEKPAAPIPNPNPQSP